MLACQHQAYDGAYAKHGLLLTPINMKERLYRRVGLFVEEHYNGHFGVTPKLPCWVQGRVPVHLWAPQGEMQEVYIV
jgi:hypothetical protein